MEDPPLRFPPQEQSTIDAIGRISDDKLLELSAIENFSEAFGRWAEFMNPA